MKDFVTKVDALVKLWSAAATLGLDITEQVGDKIRGHAINMMEKGKFMVSMYNGNVQEMPVLNAEEQGYCHSKQKLNAVKCYKARHGYSLMDSKRAIDQYCNNNGIT
mgnify:CR=1 FL=1